MSSDKLMTIAQAQEQMQKWKEYQPEGVKKPTIYPLRLTHEAVETALNESFEFHKPITTYPGLEAIRIALKIKAPSSYPELLIELANELRTAQYKNSTLTDKVEHLLTDWVNTDHAESIKSFTVTLNACKRLTTNERFGITATRAGRLLSILRNYIKREYRRSQLHTDAFWLSCCSPPVRIITLFRNDISFLDEGMPSDSTSNKIARVAMNSKMIHSFAADYRAAARYYQDLTLSIAKESSSTVLMKLVGITGSDPFLQHEKDLATGGYLKVFRFVVSAQASNSVQRPGSEPAHSILNSIFGVKTSS